MRRVQRALPASVELSWVVLPEEVRGREGAVRAINLEKAPVQ